jgi:hypothetical protein
MSGSTVVYESVPGTVIKYPNRWVSGHVNTILEQYPTGIVSRITTTKTPLCNFQACAYCDSHPHWESFIVFCRSVVLVFHLQHCLCMFSLVQDAGTG